MPGRDILRTERLTLRDAGPVDVPVIQELASDYEVIKNTGSWPWPADPAFTASRCQPIAPEAGLGGVVLHGGTIVGMASVFGEGELGYMIARDHWGQGYATEICRALVHAAFATGQWPQLRACVFDDNPGSARVLLKLGFTEGAHCTSHCTARGQDLPTRNFTLDAPRA